MFEIVKAGGIVMVPIILASIVAAAIFLERLWTLQPRRVVPAELTGVGLMPVLAERPAIGTPD